MMGIVFSLLTAFLLSIVGADVPYTQVERAFAEGDAAKVVSYGKDKILLNVFEKDGVYASSQATQILKDFFQKNPTNTFKFSYKGAVGDGASAMGNYQAKGETYRVTVKWAKISGEYKIESISILKS